MRTWWLSPANREVIVPLALGHLPWPVRAVTARSRVRQVKELSVNRSKPLMMALMDACSCLDMKLGDQQFFFGDSPTSLDATVFANLCSMIYVSLPDSRVSVLIQRNFPRLVGYVQRILVEYLHVDLTKLTLPTEENFVPHRGILDVWLSPGVVDNFFRIGAVVCLGYVVMRTWEASTSE
jgi:glutathione S-transferase